MTGVQLRAANAASQFKVLSFYPGSSACPAVLARSLHVAAHIPLIVSDIQGQMAYTLADTF